MQTTFSSKSAFLILIALLIGGVGGYFMSQRAATPPAPEKTMEKKHILLSPEELQWKAAPASLPAGAEITVIEGTPSQPGAFTMRLKLPANYRVSPHSHPADEHVTVISGTFYMGMGDVFDENVMTKLPTGGFAMMPAGTHHFARTGSDGATVQLHGIGPWGLTYVNPEDAPKK